jgi:hypothetical protein
MFRLPRPERRQPLLKVGLACAIFLVICISIAFSVTTFSEDGDRDMESQSENPQSDQCHTSTAFAVSESLTASICYDESGIFFLRMHSFNSTVTLPLSEFKELLRFLLLPSIDEVVASISKNVSGIIV